MAKRDATEEKLMALKALEDAPLNREMEKVLQKTLASAKNILVALAAKIVGKRGIENFIPVLLKAYDRFMEKPEKKDAGCLAKEAIIEALDNLEYDIEDIFLRGIKYHQHEPAYGGTVDTAVVLRGKCAFALVRIGYPDVVFELTDLLADPESRARVAAVRALAGISRDQSEPILRLKVLTDISKVLRNQLGEIGDDYQVVAECLSVLVQINPQRSMSFVARFLNSRDLILAENAAFALGESRQEEAFEILRRHREKSWDPEFQDMLLTPMAVTRLEEAFDYLIDIIENGSRDSALVAVSALAIFNDEHHRVITGNAVRSRNEARVSDAYATAESQHKWP